MVIGKQQLHYMIDVANDIHRLLPVNVNPCGNIAGFFLPYEAKVLTHVFVFVVKLSFFIVFLLPA